MVLSKVIHPCLLQPCWRCPACPQVLLGLPAPGVRSALPGGGVTTTDGHQELCSWEREHQACGWEPRDDLALPSALWMLPLKNPGEEKSAQAIPFCARASSLSGGKQSRRCSNVFLGWSPLAQRERTPSKGTSCVPPAPFLCSGMETENQSKGFCLMCQ